MLFRSRHLPGNPGADALRLAGFPMRSTLRGLHPAAERGRVRAAGLRTAGLSRPGRSRPPLARARSRAPPRSHGCRGPHPATPAARPPATETGALPPQNAKPLRLGLLFQRRGVWGSRGSSDFGCCEERQLASGTTRSQTSQVSEDFGSLCPVATASTDWGSCPCRGSRTSVPAGLRPRRAFAGSRWLPHRGFPGSCPVPRAR